MIRKNATASSLKSTIKTKKDAGSSNNSSKANCATNNSRSLYHRQSSRVRNFIIKLCRIHSIKFIRFRRQELVLSITIHITRVRIFILFFSRIKCTGMLTRLRNLLNLTGMLRLTLLHTVIISNKNSIRTPK